jgi:hypothetical protein
MQDPAYDQAPSFPRDRLDLVRRALCALAGSPNPSFPRPVHIHRISHLLRVVAERDDVEAALGSLELLTECIRLARGYWLPAPARYVDAYGVIIILAPLSTADLRKLVDVTVTVAGIGRVSASDQLRLPRQDYWSWIAAPKDIVQWTNTVLSKLRRRLSATTLDVADIDIHAARAQNGQPATKEVGRWVPLRGFKAFSGQTLCRARVGPRGYRYFFASISRGAVTHEAEVPPALRARLRFGLDVLGGSRHRIHVQSSKDKLRFELYRPLPAEEQRLIHALCVADSYEGRTIVEVNNSYRAPILESMRSIGIDLELQE